MTIRRVRFTLRQLVVAIALLSVLLAAGLEGGRGATMPWRTNTAAPPDSPAGQARYIVQRRTEFTRSRQVDDLGAHRGA